MSRRRRHSPRRHQRPSASSRANQLPLNLMKLRRPVERRSLERRSPSVCGWMRKARSSILSIAWSLRKRDRQRPIERTAQSQEKSAHLRMLLSPTQTRGHRTPGERSNNGVVGSGGLDNSDAKNREKGERNNQRGAAGDKTENASRSRSRKVR